MAVEKTYRNEKMVKDEVKRILKKHGWFFWMPPSNAFGRTGISDFNALRNQVFLVVETKFGGNKPTPMQKAFCNSILAEGGFAFVVDETTVEWFRKWCEAFDRAAEGVTKERKIADEDGATLLDAVKMMTELLV